MCFSDQKRELKFVKFCNVMKLLSKSNFYVNNFYIFVMKSIFNLNKAL